MGRAPGQWGRRRRKRASDTNTFVPRATSTGLRGPFVPGPTCRTPAQHPLDADVLVDIRPAGALGPCMLNRLSIPGDQLPDTVLFMRSKPLVGCPLHTHATRLGTVEAVTACAAGSTRSASRSASSSCSRACPHRPTLRIPPGLAPRRASSTRGRPTVTLPHYLHLVRPAHAPIGCDGGRTRPKRRRDDFKHARHSRRPTPDPLL